MTRPSLWIVGILALIIFLLAYGIYFFSAGGGGLYRAVVYYLIPNLPDKKHSWQDFIYKGEKGSTSGFYAGGNDESIKIWTLSGLKRFYTKPGLSIYSFRDTCAAYKNLRESSTEAVENEETTYFTLSQWQNELEQENFVTIWPYAKENGRVVIDKALARSGKYKVFGRIEEGVCD